MTATLTETAITLLLVIWWQWRELREESKWTRITCIALLLLAGTLWIYYSTSLHVPRPTVWFMDRLKGLVPIL